MRFYTTTMQVKKLANISLISLLLLNLCNVPTAMVSSFLIKGDHISHSSYTKRNLDQHQINMSFLDDFFQNVDNFIDDATNRKLGGGSTFYGERKSSFSETSKSYASISQQESDKRDKARSGSNFNLDPLRKLRAGKMSGKQLRNLVFKQWGQQFPVLIKRKRDALGQQRLYVVVQWKYLGKVICLRYLICNNVCWDPK